jgi:hypothetical protein
MTQSSEKKLVDRARGGQDGVDSVTKAESKNPARKERRWKDKAAQGEAGEKAKAEKEQQEAEEMVERAENERKKREQEAKEMPPRGRRRGKINKSQRPRGRTTVRERSRGGTLMRGGMRTARRSRLCMIFDMVSSRKGRKKRTSKRQKHKR